MSSDSRHATTTEQQEPVERRRRSAAVNLLRSRERVMHEQVDLTPNELARTMILPRAKYRPNDVSLDPIS